MMTSVGAQVSGLGKGAIGYKDWTGWLEQTRGVNLAALVVFAQNEREPLAAAL